MPNLDDLGPLELEVMRVVWRLKSVTVRDVLDSLAGEERNPAYTTIQTVMTRLEDKGFLKHKLHGKTYHYMAKVSQEKVQRRMTESFLDRVFDGAVGPLVTQLAESKRLSPDDLEALRKIVNEIDPGEETGNETQTQTGDAPL